MLQSEPQDAYPLTKAQATAFRERWRRANAQEAEELRSTSLEVRLQQFFTLLDWARQFGLTECPDGEMPEVRERWQRLRKALRA